MVSPKTNSGRRTPKLDWPNVTTTSGDYCITKQSVLKANGCKKLQYVLETQTLLLTGTILHANKSFVQNNKWFTENGIYQNVIQELSTP